MPYVVRILQLVVQAARRVRDREDIGETVLLQCARHLLVAQIYMLSRRQHVPMHQR
jgi:hypothetical protein